MGGRGSSTNNLKAELKSAQSRRDFFMKARDNARNIEEYKTYDEEVKKYGQKVVDILNATKGEI